MIFPRDRAFLGGAGSIGISGGTLSEYKREKEERSPLTCSEAEIDVPPEGLKLTNTVTDAWRSCEEDRESRERDEYEKRLLKWPSKTSLYTPALVRPMLPG